MYKKITLLVLITVLLTGCSGMLGKNALEGNVNGMEQLVTQKDWELVKEKSNQLEEAYLSNKWKLQLIGDEGEYESLYRAIKRLSAAIDEKNTTQAKLELATIESILEEIYSL